MKYDVLVVGAGISGATLAERYATIAGKRVLVLEKRNHIGGNCYDYLNSDGILVPAYGPHFFHTNFEDVWEYVNRFSGWIPYEHRVLSAVDGKLLPVPVNILTVNELFGLRLSTEAEMKQWLEENTAKIDAPANSEEAALRRVGPQLYEKLFKPYTHKQWDRWPSELDASVMDRIPVRTTFEDRYFTDKYQAMPEKGYAKLFERMLDNPLIEVRLGVDYMNAKDLFRDVKKTLFTGPIDEFFGYKFGERLEYRSLRFEYETRDEEYYQATAQINYPSPDVAFTRITEPKRATGQQHSKTTIIREYSTWEGEPYYPVPSERNRHLYERYRQEAIALEKDGIHFVGRLANYKYFNMDQAFQNALKFFANLEKGNSYHE